MVYVVCLQSGDQFYDSDRDVSSNSGGRYGMALADLMVAEQGGLGRVLAESRESMPSHVRGFDRNRFRELCDEADVLFSNVSTTGADVLYDLLHDAGYSQSRLDDLDLRGLRRVSELCLS